MSYDLHIERIVKAGEEPQPIPLEEWKAALSTTAGVRLFQGTKHTTKNPRTGEVISIGTREGDAEVLFPSENRWVLVFSWFEGQASFRAPLDPKLKIELNGPVWPVAVVLATKLNAVIRGDEGAAYDFATGRTIMS